MIIEVSKQSFADLIAIRNEVIKVLSNNDKLITVSRNQTCARDIHAKLEQEQKHLRQLLNNVNWEIRQRLCGVIL